MISKKKVRWYIVIVFRGLDDAYKELSREFDNFNLEKAKKKILGVSDNSKFAYRSLLKSCSLCYLEYDDIFYNRGIALAYPGLWLSYVDVAHCYAENYDFLLKKLTVYRDYSLRHIIKQIGNLCICFYNINSAWFLTGVVDDEIVFFYCLCAFDDHAVSIDEVSLVKDKIKVCYIIVNNKERLKYYLGMRINVKDYSIDEVWNR